MSERLLLAPALLAAPDKWLALRSRSASMALALALKPLLPLLLELHGSKDAIVPWLPFSVWHWRWWGVLGSVAHA